MSCLGSRPLPPAARLLRSRTAMVRLLDRLRWPRPFRPGRNHAQRLGSVLDRGAWVIGAIVPKVLVLVIVAVSQVPPSPPWRWGHPRHGDDDEDEDFRHDGPDHPRSTVEHRAKSLGMVPPWPERPGPPKAVQEPDHRRPRPQEPRRRREWPGTQTGHSGLFLAHDQVRTICRSTPWARSLILS